MNLYYSDYAVGTKLIHTESGIRGVVVPTFKLPGDVCVEWENGLVASYDDEFLGTICEVENGEGTEKTEEEHVDLR